MKLIKNMETAELAAYIGRNNPACHEVSESLTLPKQVDVEVVTDAELQIAEMCGRCALRPACKELAKRGREHLPRPSVYAGVVFLGGLHKQWAVDTLAADPEDRFRRTGDVLGPSRRKR